LGIWGGEKEIKKIKCFFIGAEGKLILGELSKENELYSKKLRGSAMFSLEKTEKKKFLAAAFKGGRSLKQGIEGAGGETIVG